ncbi:alpha/beta fold hydrolase [Pseudomonas knackmussii]|uniref:alpha/beta fold hydrolase n=1 Tax=Pseudomonas knackmussii TaxID=65741 RepID=UPI001362152D|nr:alpha/beta fold hydrolase [Pseudomonas knackmussii]
MKNIQIINSPRPTELPSLDDIANELYAYIFTNKFINDNNGTLGGPDADLANADLLWYRAQQKQQLTLDYQAHDGTGYLLIADYLAHPASNGRTVLGIHGYGSQAANAGAWAKVFYDQGYNVFTPDLRGHGRSADPSRSMGTLDTGDMLRWIDEIMKLDPNGEIVVIGVSLGAAVAMQLVSESQLPSNVFAIIEDCGYRTLREVVRKQIDTNAGSLTSDEKDQVFGKIDDLLFQKQGKRIADGLSEERLAAARLPLLAISGSSDQSVPPSMTADILSLYGGADKDMWIVQGAGHPSSIATENANYRLRVEAFLNYCQGYPYIAGVESRKTVIVGSEVDLLEGVTARDLLDGDLTASIEITGAVDTQAVGAYPITYSVTNSAGLTSAMESRIQVIAPRPPIPFYALSLTAPIGAPSSVFQGQANIDLEISVRSNNASELTQLDANGIAVIALFPDYQPFYDIGVANPTLVTLQPQEERTLSCNCTIGNDIPPGIYYLAVRINAENITDFVTCSGIDGVTPYTLIEVKANPQ